TQRLALTQAGEGRELDQISERLVLALAARGQQLLRLLGLEPAQPALRFVLQLDLRHRVEHAPLLVREREQVAQQRKRSVHGGGAQWPPGPGLALADLPHRGQPLRLVYADPIRRDVGEW